MKIDEDVCCLEQCHEVLKKRITDSVHPTVPFGRSFQPTSVMILFSSVWPHGKIWEADLLFIQKADIKGYPWRNQMAFPGGHRDPEDVNREATAVRELEEELGISVDDVELIGSIGHFLTLKSKEIEAFVGIWKENEEIEFDTAEISRVFRIPLTLLMATHRSNGYSGRLPDVTELTYPFQDVVIWGVTAKIVHHLLEMLWPYATLFDGVG